MTGVEQVAQLSQRERGRVGRYSQKKTW